MNFCQLDETVKPRLMSLIDFLYQECLSSGGDGDAFWYSKHYNIEDILPLIEEYNSKLRFPWEIRHDREKQRIDWGEGQEWVMITNDERLYKLTPEWAQCLIKW